MGFQQEIGVGMIILFHGIRAVAVAVAVAAREREREIERVWSLANKTITEPRS